MKRRGLVFDFDGTISLSEPIHARAWEDLAAERNMPLPQGFVAYGVGRPDRALALWLAEHWNDGTTQATLLAAKRRHYLRRIPNEATLVPGVKEFLALGHAHQWPIGLATSAGLADVEPILTNQGIMQYFGAVYTVETVEHPKPHPEIYLRAAAALGIEPSASFAFEDSPPGAAAARAAGFPVIGLTTSYAAHELGGLFDAIADYRDLSALRTRLAL